MHGPEGVRVHTRLKTIASRWPGGMKSGADFKMPTTKWMRFQTLSCAMHMDEPGRPRAYAASRQPLSRGGPGLTASINSRVRLTLPPAAAVRSRTSLETVTMSKPQATALAA